MAIVGTGRDSVDDSIAPLLEVNSEVYDIGDRFPCLDRLVLVLLEML